MINHEKSYSGGLTLPDIRDIYDAYKANKGSGKRYGSLYQELASRYRRTEGAMAQLIITLKRIEEGNGKTYGNQSTLWKMTEEERAYVFRRPAPVAAHEEVALPVEDVTTPMPEMCDIVSLLREVVAEVQGLRAAVERAWS